MKNKYVMYVLITSLVLSMSSCVKPSNGTTEAPLVNTPVILANTLSIASSGSFVDSQGIYHVVGEVVNNTSSALTSIELTIEIKDSDGNSLIKDNNGNAAPNAILYPMLYTLAPGEASPFEYSYATVAGTPASFDVSITGQVTGNANRAALQAKNVQLVDDGSGRYYLTGKLVNTGSQWAHINGLAGAVLDDSGKVLSANSTATYATELAPAGDTNSRNQTPFEIEFPNPGGGTKWQLYMDANIAENVVDYPLEIKVTNTYYDEYGSARIVGLMTNNSDKPLDSLVVAGLYSADGTALDASYAFVPVPIKPGSNAPFSISSFNSVNFNPIQAALVSTISTQVDPWFTSPTSYEFVDLSVAGDTVEKNGATWVFNGNVNNTGTNSLSGITIIAMVLNAQDTLVAMEYTTIYPSGDAIAAGESNPYSVAVYLDPKADTSSFTTTVVAVGDL